MAVMSAPGAARPVTASLLVSPFGDEGGSGEDEREGDGGREGMMGEEHGKE